MELSAIKGCPMMVIFCVGPMAPMRWYCDPLGPRLCRHLETEIMVPDHFHCHFLDLSIIW